LKVIFFCNSFSFFGGHVIQFFHFFCIWWSRPKSSPWLVPILRVIFSPFLEVTCPIFFHFFEAGQDHRYTHAALKVIFFLETPSPFLEVTWRL
jgi:hypothetical protein